MRARPPRVRRESIGVARIQSIVPVAIRQFPPPIRRTSSWRKLLLTGSLVLNAVVLAGCNAEGTCVVIDHSEAQYNSDFCWVQYVESACGEVGAPPDKTARFYAEDASKGQTRCARDGFASDGSEFEIKEAIEAGRAVAYTRSKSMQRESDARR